jgi:hypothetical protein
MNEEILIGLGEVSEETKGCVPEEIEGGDLDFKECS